MLPVDMGANGGIVTMSFGGAIWVAAHCFVAFFASEATRGALMALASRSKKDSGQPMQVLELGAGTGICGLSVQTFYREDIVLTLTDCARDVMLLLQSNSRRNGDTARCEQLIWGQPASIEPRVGLYDLILASDCSYSLQVALKP